MAAPSPEQIVALSGLLCERGLFSAVWTDDDLVATHRLGDLVSGIPVGAPITESMLPLFGFDEQILALRRRPSGSVMIPNVLIDPAHRNGQRINVIVLRLSDSGGYLLLVTRAIAGHDLEVTLAAQVRARAIAEADATAKSLLIARTNEELARANQDLQEFASVISHDLRSPLRRLRYFAADAAKAIEDDRGGEAVAALTRVQEQSRRMGSMLTGLLEYSRIGRKREAAEPVDTAALVAEIVESIEHPAGIEIVVEGAWPAIVTVSQALDIVLRNLIDNAVKHHDLATGTILLHGEDAPDTWIFSVVDDGPGIPPEWHAAIFEPFKRILDEDEAPEGSGIGLALVKKTVDVAGGRIEIRSDPRKARGTTFRIHWPKQSSP